MRVDTSSRSNGPMDFRPRLPRRGASLPDNASNVEIKFSRRSFSACRPWMMLLRSITEPEPLNLNLNAWQREGRLPWLAISRRFHHIFGALWLQNNKGKPEEGWGDSGLVLS